MYERGKTNYDFFLKKYGFDPKWNGAAVQLFLKHWEEKISFLDFNVGYSILTKCGRDFIFLLKAMIKYC